MYRDQLKVPLFVKLDDDLIIAVKDIVSLWKHDKKIKEKANHNYELKTTNGSWNLNDSAGEYLMRMLPSLGVE